MNAFFSPNRLILIIAASGVLVVCVIVGALNFWSRTVETHPYYADKGFRIIAHRGGMGLGPENTLETFRRSIASGADALEIDLRMSKDGHLVALHDETVDRTTNGSGAVKEMKLAQIKSLDAGYHWTSDGGRSFPFRGLGLVVPTLDEVFDAFPNTPIVIEIKDNRSEICDSLCLAIGHHRRKDSTLVSSFHTDLLKKFRSNCTHVATAAGFSEALMFSILVKTGFSSLYTPAIQALLVPETFKNRLVVSRRWVAAAHSRNLRVEVWTVNEAAAMKRLITAGVDGIITDYPDLLARALKSAH
jgi:glycerophosphoryl diester phosphodiesterase